MKKKTLGVGTTPLVDWGVAGSAAKCTAITSSDSPSEVFDLRFRSLAIFFWKKSNEKLKRYKIKWLAQLCDIHKSEKWCAAPMLW